MAGAEDQQSIDQAKAWLPEAAAELESVCGKGIAVEIDWESFAGQSPRLRALSQGHFGAVTDAFGLLVGRTRGGGATKAMLLPPAQKALLDRVRRIVIGCCAGAEKGCKIEGDTVTVQGAWGSFRPADLLRPRDIAEPLVAAAELPAGASRFAATEARLAELCGRPIAWAVDDASLACCRDPSGVTGFADRFVRAIERQQERDPDALAAALGAFDRVELIDADVDWGQVELDVPRRVMRIQIGFDRPNIDLDARLAEAFELAHEEEALRAEASRAEAEAARAREQEESDLRAQTERAEREAAARERLEREAEERERARQEREARAPASCRPPAGLTVEQKRERAREAVLTYASLIVAAMQAAFGQMSEESLSATDVADVRAAAEGAAKLDRLGTADEEALDAILAVVYRHDLAPLPRIDERLSDEDLARYLRLVAREDGALGDLVKELTRTLEAIG